MSMKAKESLEKEERYESSLASSPGGSRGPL